MKVRNTWVEFRDTWMEFGSLGGALGAERALGSPIGWGFYEVLVVSVDSWGSPWVPGGSPWIPGCFCGFPVVFWGSWSCFDVLSWGFLVPTGVWGFLGIFWDFWWSSWILGDLHGFLMGSWWFLTNFKQFISPNAIQKLDTCYFSSWFWFIVLLSILEKKISLQKKFFPTINSPSSISTPVRRQVTFSHSIQSWQS